MFSSGLSQLVWAPSLPSESCRPQKGRKAEPLCSPPQKGLWRSCNRKRKRAYPWHCPGHRPASLLAEGEVTLRMLRRRTRPSSPLIAGFWMREGTRAAPGGVPLPPQLSAAGPGGAHVPPQHSAVGVLASPLIQNLHRWAKVLPIYLLGFGGAFPAPGPHHPEKGLLLSSVRALGHRPTHPGPLRLRL